MHTIVLLGEPDQGRLQTFLIDAFNNQAVFFYEKNKEMKKSGQGAVEVLLIDTPDLNSVKIEDCLVVCKEKMNLQKAKNFFTTGHCILNSANKEAVALAADLQCSTITLGLGSTDTFSLSSMLDNSCVISLLRVIENRKGEKIEPFDIVIEKTRNITDYYLLVWVFFMLYFELSMVLEKKIKI